MRDATECLVPLEAFRGRIFDCTLVVASPAKRLRKSAIRVALVLRVFLRNPRRADPLFPEDIATRWPRERRRGARLSLRLQTVGEWSQTASFRRTSHGRRDEEEVSKGSTRSAWSTEATGRHRRTPLRRIRTAMSIIILTHYYN